MTTFTGRKFRPKEQMMRQAFTVLASAGLILLLSASDASAQRSGYGGRSSNRGCSSGYGNGGSYSHSSYGSPFYGAQAYRPYSQNYGDSYGRSRGAYGYSQSYYSPYSYSQSYYFETAPRYSVVPATDFIPVPTTLIPAPQANLADQPYATITVTVPTLDTQVWFGSTLMTEQGMPRVYQSTPLEVGSTYTYSIKARWMVGGNAVEQMRRVDVKAGKNSAVDFQAVNREYAPAPEPTIAK